LLLRQILLFLIIQLGRQQQTGSRELFVFSSGIPCPDKEYRGKNLPGKNISLTLLTHKPEKPTSFLL